MNELSFDLAEVFHETERCVWLSFYRGNAGYQVRCTLLAPERWKVELESDIAPWSLTGLGEVYRVWDAPHAWYADVFNQQPNGAPTFNSIVEEVLRLHVYGR